MDALAKMLLLRPGYKTKAAGFGLIALAVAQFLLGLAGSDGPIAADVDTAIQTGLAGLAALGIGAKIDRKFPE